MKRYTIRVPVVGYVDVEVEAETREVAFNEALAMDLDLDLIEEWDAYRHITEGNVLRVPYNSIHAISEEEIDE